MHLSNFLSGISTPQINSFSTASALDFQLSQGKKFRLRKSADKTKTYQTSPKNSKTNIEGSSLECLTPFYTHTRNKSAMYFQPKSYGTKNNNFRDNSETSLFNFDRKREIGRKTEYTRKMIGKEKRDYKRDFERFSFKPLRQSVYQNLTHKKRKEMAQVNLKHKFCNLIGLPCPGKKCKLDCFNKRFEEFLVKNNLCILKDTDKIFGRELYFIKQNEIAKTQIYEFLEKNQQNIKIEEILQKVKAFGETHIKVPLKRVNQSKSLCKEKCEASQNEKRTVIVKTGQKGLKIKNIKFLNSKHKQSNSTLNLQQKYEFEQTKQELQHTKRKSSHQLEVQISDSKMIRKDSLSRFYNEPQKVNKQSLHKTSSFASFDNEKDFDQKLLNRKKESKKIMKIFHDANYQSENKVKFNFSQNQTNNTIDLNQNQNNQHSKRESGIQFEKQTKKKNKSIKQYSSQNVQVKHSTQINKLYNEQNEKYKLKNFNMVSQPRSRKLIKTSHKKTYGSEKQVQSFSQISINLKQNGDGNNTEEDSEQAASIQNSIDDINSEDLETKLRDLMNVERLVNKFGLVSHQNFDFNKNKQLSKVKSTQIIGHNQVFPMKKKIQKIRTSHCNSRVKYESGIIEIKNQSILSSLKLASQKTLDKANQSQKTIRSRKKINKGGQSLHRIKVDAENQSFSQNDDEEKSKAFDETPFSRKKKSNHEIKQEKKKIYMNHKLIENVEKQLFESGLKKSIICINDSLLTQKRKVRFINKEIQSGKIKSNVKQVKKYLQFYQETNKKQSSFQNKVNPEIREMTAEKQTEQNFMKMIQKQKMFKFYELKNKKEQQTKQYSDSFFHQFVKEDSLFEFRLAKKQSIKRPDENCGNRHFLTSFETYATEKQKVPFDFYHFLSMGTNIAQRKMNEEKDQNLNGIETKNLQ